MEIKRGWWREGSGHYAFLAGQHGNRWYGLDSGLDPNSWDSVSGRSASDNYRWFDLTDHFAGDGPEPVEPETKPDPKDLEIERLKCYAESLRIELSRYRGTYENLVENLKELIE